uniref:tRNAHis guanylyltransferase catalytic domain-containing protein n=1 Tax=Arcella intermedia TaxID=1963864 RepID=A0A6B2LJK8_9EUKA
MAELGEKMKEYENECFGKLVLDDSKPFVIRLDGHRFSKFTSHFKKPFDERIFTAMLYTTKDLMEEFLPTTAYTASDEITLIFPPLTNEEKEKGAHLIYNGRIQKILSLTSGLCSVRFSQHIANQQFDPTREATVLSKLGYQSFDSRIFNVPSMEEALNNLIWRVSDIRRNSVTNLGQCSFAQNVLTGLSSMEATFISPNNP